MHFLVNLCVLFLTIKIAVTSKCDVYVDITDGVREGTSITKDGVLYTPDNYFEVGDTIQGCICNVKNCVRKCCSKGEAMNLTTRRCIASTDEGIIPGFINFNIINVPENSICADQEVKIKISEDFSFIGDVLVWDDMKFAMNNYCLAVTPENTVYAIACVVNEETRVESIIMSLGMLISMPFLALTFLVYMILPDSSIHKRAQAAYVLSLLLAYICLVTVQLHKIDSEPIPDVPCQFLGYSIIFFFIVSFCWLNVMSIDMWLAFSGLTRFVGSQSADIKRFVYYTAYATGIPLLLIAIVGLMNSGSNMKSVFHPKLGYGRCFLDDGYPNLFYFYLPMAILISVNVVLFILTSVKIQQIKKETAMLKKNDSKRHAYENDKQRFNLYLKLMLAMGVNWSMEFISWLINWLVQPFPTAVWYLTDFVNAAYGVFIFFIFVYKRKVWLQLQKRYYLWTGRPHQAQALSVTTTRTSALSTTDLSSHQNEVPLNNMRNRNGEERPLSRD